MTQRRTGDCEPVGKAVVGDSQRDQGQEFIVEDLCPPLCHELWSNIYPLVYALQNGADLDYGNVRAKVFDAKCPDECRVCIHGEIIED